MAHLATIRPNISWIGEVCYTLYTTYLTSLVDNHWSTAGLQVNSSILKAGIRSNPLFLLEGITICQPILPLAVHWTRLHCTTFICTALLLQCTKYIGTALLLHCTTSSLSVGHHTRLDCTVLQTVLYCSVHTALHGISKHYYPAPFVCTFQIVFLFPLSTETLSGAGLLPLLLCNQYHSVFNICNSPPLPNLFFYLL